ncbi:ferritin-like domain-containing protein [Hymenobacter sp. B81]|uniref:ferritin-like domain-containing protein n=1 Tax=Hymenobacter sp. B81 TaxID=3344878 RepID=UPI0037DDDAFD
MNVFQIITEIEKVDPEVYERLDSRRRMFKHFAGFGKTLAAAAVPLALGSMFNKAYGQGSGLPQNIRDVLNFALTLEWLEYHYYNEALSKGAALIPTGAATTAITDIRNNELAHVNFLKDVLKTDVDPTLVTVPASRFDFTADGNFATVFSNYDTFLAVAQAFEDTGVRAYKGQAAELISNNTVLEAALNIHSVEARHASHIRTMRRVRANAVGATPNTATAGSPSFSASPKSWIVGNDGNGPAPGKTDAIYAGEELTTQAGVSLAGIATANSLSATAASEAFDEPLTKAQVLSIVTPFLN